MKPPETTPQGRLAALLSLFGDGALGAGQLEIISKEELPEPYQSLLAHNHHMTVTLESRHDSAVELVVLDEHVDETFYARRLLLRTPVARNGAAAGGQVVMAGMMRIQLNYCEPPVREAILARQTPLGRILIKNEVLRWIEPEGYLRLRLDADGRRLFGAPTATVTYGRLATIFCNGEPAVELLEVIAPELEPGPANGTSDEPEQQSTK